MTLAKTHRVNIDAAGLARYGKPTGFYKRQLRTWRELSETQSSVIDFETGASVGPVPGIAGMLEFFSNENYHPKDRGTLIHGDYKIDNLMYHKSEPRIIGILE